MVDPKTESLTSDGVGGMRIVWLCWGKDDCMRAARGALRVLSLSKVPKMDSRDESPGLDFECGSWLVIELLECGSDISTPVLQSAVIYSLERCVVGKGKTTWEETLG